MTVQDRVDAVLDQALWEAWLKVQDKVLGHEIELRRRLDRRAKMFGHVPRPLCLAIKASDRRVNEMTAHLSPRNAVDKGQEAEHDVLLVARTIKDLCRPVELYWGQKFRTLARELGAPRQVPRRLEQRGILRARRIPLLAGRRGLPVPTVDSPVPATAPPDLREWEDYGHPKLLDPSAWGYAAPDKLLAPYWQHLSERLPDWFEQTLRRKPIFRVQRGRLRFMHWVWLCPECGRDVKTIYLPLGAPDFATIHNIERFAGERSEPQCRGCGSRAMSEEEQGSNTCDDERSSHRTADASSGRYGRLQAALELPHANSYDLPEPHLCFACKRCHHLFDLARTPKSIHTSWSLLVAHLSSGLLFGHEVPRPASFAALRPNRPLAAPRPSPRRDELEAYLAQTDLPLKEIARRMGWTYASVIHELHLICKKRRLRGGRPALKRWWITHRSQSPLAA